MLGKIGDEANIRSEADSVLTDGLNSEITNRTNADDSLEKKISDEVSARTAADKTLQSNIDKEASARTTADSTEATTRANADKTLQSNIDKEASARTAADSTEATARANSDKTLQDNLDKEASARTAADSTLQSNIDKETSARTSADSTEATTRANADKTLQDNLDKEASARTAADSTLQSNIDKEASARTSADSTEATTRANADKTLQDNIDSHTSNKSNPHAVTSAQVGLGNVVNIDQSKAIKSITRNGLTFTATCLDGTTFIFSQQDTTYPDATASAHGLMSASDKSKLDGIAAGANKYTHPSYTAKSSGLYKVTVDGTGHVSAATAVTKADITALGIPGQDTNTTYSTMTGASTSADGSSGLVPAPAKGNANRYLRSDGTWSVPPDTNTDTTYSTMTGASTSADGSSGLVPAPAKGNANRYLRSDGTWSVPPDTNTTYGVASSSSNGLMSASDKSKLDGIAAGANKYTHPSYTAKSSGLYKVTVDGTGHVSAATAVTKADITALGIPGQDTNTTYSDATTSAHGLMSASDKSKLNGIASGATKNVSTVKSFTLSASSWSSGAYTISDSLITASSNQEVLPATTITAAQYNALSKAQIIDGGQSAGKLTLKALGTVPTIDIPIRVIFRGTI